MWLTTPGAGPVCPPHGWKHVIAIAETLGAPVWDCNSRLNFPSDHPLNLSMAAKECYDGADVVLALDIADFEGPTHVRDIATRTVINMVPQTATWIDIGFTDIEVSKWSMDYARTFHARHRMTADPVIGTTQLLALLKERIGRNADIAGKIAARAAETGNAQASFALAETYDPLVLRKWGAYGTLGDAAKARDLYTRAQAGGIKEARERFDALRR